VMMAFAKTFIFVTDATLVAVTALDGIVRTVQTVIGVFQTLAMVVEAASIPLMVAFMGPQKALETFKNDLDGTLDNLLAFGERGDGALNSMGESLANISVKAEAGFAAIKDGTAAAIEPTVALGEKINELSEIEQKRIDKLKEWAEELATQSEDAGSQYQLQLEMLQEKFAQDLITEEEYLIAKSELQDTYMASETAKLEEARARDLIDENTYRNAKLTLANKQRLADTKAATEKQKFDEKVDAARLQAVQSVFGAIAQLSTSGNRRIAEIGKAAAITTATIDGFVAVQKALASAPPPFNIAIAAATGATAAMNVAKIAGVQLNQGGIVPGAGPNRDSVPARLTPGELVVDRNTTKQLQRFLENQAGGIGLEISFKDNLVDYIEAKILERQTLGTSQLTGRF
jgi:hypothetical protein